MSPCWNCGASPRVVDHYELRDERGNVLAVSEQQQPNGGYPAPDVLLRARRPFIVRPVLA